MDFRDARLGYARHLGAVHGRRARLLRRKIEAVLDAVPPSGDGTVVLALTRSERALLGEIDQRELDALLAPPATADPPAAAQRDSPADGPPAREP